MTARIESVAWPGRSARRLLRRWSSSATRTVREAEATWLVLLSILTLVFAAMSRVFQDAWPLSSYVLPLLLAMNAMSFARLVALEVLTVCCMGYTLTQIEITALRLFGLAIVLVAGFIVTVHTRSRTKLGLQAIRGDSMLIDLRDRLATQSQLPTLPHGWYAESVMKSAGGASFSGDFIVASKARRGELLELAVVDVSGKGLNAGTRSLQLSGALGGLLGSLPTHEFLPAANEYLLRQEWDEGFATAIHLAVNLTTGQFELRTAGHPPALQFQAGSGRWTVHWTSGPVLGVVDAADYVEHSGLLQVGDAILLYTDGLVESPHRDIAFGIDKLLGEAERLVQRGFRGGAERLVAGVNSTSDDRALVLLHRQ